MKIGSGGSSISFSNLNVANMVEEKADVAEEKTEDGVQPDSEESSKDAAEAISANSSHSLGRLNLLARSFVHQEQEDEDNYSIKNLKASQANSSMMAKYNLIINGIIDYRLDRTESLMEEGLSTGDAKAIARIEASKFGKQAHEKLVGDVNEDHLEKEAKEIKEDTEKRTEEVVEKKQEEKKTEAKEAEAKTDPNNADAKVSESNPETVNPAQTGQSGVEAGSTESIASGSVGVEAGASTAKGAASGNADSSSTSAGTRKKVDVIV